MKAKQRENQQHIREELQRQMEDHKLAKKEEKLHDLEYFEVIRR